MGNATKEILLKEISVFMIKKDYRSALDYVSNLADTLYFKKRYEGALEYLKAFILILDDFKVKEGDYYIPVYQKIIPIKYQLKKKEGLVEDILTLTEFYIEKSSFDSAVRLLVEALKFNPDNIEIYNKLGLLYAYKRELKQAFETINKSLNIDKMNIPTLFTLGDIHRLAGNFTEALRIYKEIERLKNDFPLISDRIRETENELRWKERSLEEISILKPKPEEVLSDNVKTKAIEEKLEIKEEVLKHETEAKKEKLAASEAVLGDKNFFEETLLSFLDDSKFIQFLEYPSFLDRKEHLVKLLLQKVKNKGSKKKLLEVLLKLKLISYVNFFELLNLKVEINDNENFDLLISYFESNLKDFKESKEVLFKFENIASNDFNSLCYLASFAKILKEYEFAYKIYKKVLNIKNDDKTFFVDMVDIAFLSERFDLLLDFYDAFNINKEYKELIVDTALENFSEGKDESFKKFLEGIKLFLKKKYKSSIDIFKSLIDTGSKSLFNYLFLSFSFYFLENSENAIKQIDEGIANRNMSKEELSILKYYKGKLLFELNDIDAAYECLSSIKNIPFYSIDIKDLEDMVFKKE